MGSFIPIIPILKRRIYFRHHNDRQPIYFLAHGSPATPGVTAHLEVIKLIHWPTCTLSDLPSPNHDDIWTRKNIFVGVFSSMQYAVKKTLRYHRGRRSLLCSSLIISVQPQLPSMPITIYPQIID